MVTAATVSPSFNLDTHRQEISTTATARLTHRFKAGAAETDRLGKTTEMAKIRSRAMFVICKGPTRSITFTTKERERAIIHARSISGIAVHTPRRRDVNDVGFDFKLRESAAKVFRHLSRRIRLSSL